MWYYYKVEYFSILNHTFPKLFIVMATVAWVRWRLATQTTWVQIPIQFSIMLQTVITCSCLGRFINQTLVNIFNTLHEHNFICRKHFFKKLLRPQINLACDLFNIFVKFLHQTVCKDKKSPIRSSFKFLWSSWIELKL